MIITVDEHTFREQFENIRPNNFSYDGITLLFNYLDDMDFENDMELDVIAICCDFVEYENFEELQKEYDVESIEELRNFTTVLTGDDPQNPVLIQCY